MRSAHHESEQKQEEKDGVSRDERWCAERALHGSIATDRAGLAIEVENGFLAAYLVRAAAGG